jgi:hypothetical protein
VVTIKLLVGKVFTNNKSKFSQEGTFDSLSSTLDKFWFILWKNHKIQTQKNGILIWRKNNLAFYMYLN